MTETSGIAIGTPGGPFQHLDKPLHPGSIGVLFPGHEGKVKYSKKLFKVCMARISYSCPVKCGNTSHNLETVVLISPVYCHLDCVMYCVM